MYLVLFINKNIKQ